MITSIWIVVFIMSYLIKSEIYLELTKVFDSKIEQDFSNWTNSEQNIELSNYDKTSLNHVKFKFLSPAYLEISRVGDNIVDQETGVVLLCLVGKWQLQNDWNLRRQCLASSQRQVYHIIISRSGQLWENVENPVSSE